MNTMEQNSEQTSEKDLNDFNKKDKEDEIDEAGLPQDTQTAVIVSPPPVVPRPPPPPAFLPNATFKPPLEVPDPVKKMKTLSWNKISSLKDGSVWFLIKEEKGNIRVNYSELEDQFSCKECVQKRSSKYSKSYLDSKKAMRIGIFLRKFKTSPENVVALIARGITKDMEHYRFKALKEHLPSKDEAELLKDIDAEELATLSTPDVFMVHLIRLPNYRIYIDAMVLQGELSEMDYLQDIVKAMASACRGIMESSSFRNFLKYILQIGLFMNKGKVAGKANGFDILSLSELKRTKSKDESTTLLDYIINDLANSNPTCLEFVSEIKDLLEGTKRFSISQVKEEFTTLKQKRDDIMENVNSSEFESKGQFAEFEKISTTYIDQNEDIFERVNRLSERVAHFFGVDKINLDELCCCFREFCEDAEKIKVKSMEIKRRSQPISKNGMTRRYSEQHINHHVKDMKLLQKLAEQKRRSESVTTFAVKFGVSDQIR